MIASTLQHGSSVVDAPTSQAVGCGGNLPANDHKDFSIVPPHAPKAHFDAMHAMHRAPVLPHLQPALFKDEAVVGPGGGGDQHHLAAGQGTRETGQGRFAVGKGWGDNGLLPADHTATARGCQALASNSSHCCGATTYRLPAAELQAKVAGQCVTTTHCADCLHNPKPHLRV